TSLRITCEQEKFQILLQELSMFSKREKVKNVDEKENTVGFVLQIEIGFSYTVY
ncbi:2814_t:CDS:2, partial [Funneliformis mosseae]